MAGIANSGTATLMLHAQRQLGGVGGGIDNLAAATAMLEDTIVAANTAAGGTAATLAAPMPPASPAHMTWWAPAAPAGSPAAAGDIF